MMVLSCVNKACFIFLQAMGKAVSSTLLSMVREIVFGVGFALLHRDNTLVMLGGLAMSGLAIFMHRGNIARLLKGQERKTNLFSKKGKQS